MDPGTRRLALIAGGLGGTLLVVVGGWSAIGHRSGSVPVVQADSRPIRVKPDNPGGMQVAGANEDILSGDPDTNSGKLAPPPEAPNPQAMRAPPPPAPPAVVASPAPTAATAAARLTPEKSAAAPVKAAALPAPDKAAAADKAAIAPDKHAATTAAAPAPDHSASAAKGALVQLAAVSSEAAAKVEWQRLQKRMPDLLDHRQPTISKIDREGHTLWRVRTGGFSDSAQATVFCERVRAKGTGCSVADF
jgi:hypothetical protein